MPVHSITSDGHVVSKGLNNATFRFLNPHDDELDTANYADGELLVFIKLRGFKGHHALVADVPLLRMTW